VSQVEILPLGGAGEIGRNCTLLIQGDDMIMIDCGISFPNEEMHGVDVVIPDFSYVLENREKLRGIILTHAHEDHIGALSHFLKELKTPIYATTFCHAMIRPKLEERMDTKGLKFEEVRPGAKLKMGKLEVEWVRVTHSIPEACGIAVHTEHGIVFFTGDFKIDFTPVDGKTTDIHRLTELGNEGVVCLLSDSTNVDRPGFGPSESSVTDGFRKAFSKAEGRILVTMFASNIHRMQQAMDMAEEQGRKVAVAGRRMEQTIDICTRLGYLKPPKGIRIRLDEAYDFEPEKVVILTTGSQGEPMSALVQMSRGEYSRMKVVPGDTIVYSARPIPGNESAIFRTINRLFKLGATVVYDQKPAVHASGHAYQDELKMMINLVKPFYLAPIHGEPRHQHAYCEMALEMGHAPHRMFKLYDGAKLIMDDTKAWMEEVTDGADVWIDRSGNEVPAQVVRERVALAEMGVIVLQIAVTKGGLESVTATTNGVGGPSKIAQLAATAAGDALAILTAAELQDHALVQKTATDGARAFLQRRFQLRPVFVPVVFEV
jgi:ribonuclease J